MSELDDKGVRVPGWAIGIVSGVISVAIAGLFAFVVDTREDVVRLETEVSLVKVNAALLGSVPADMRELKVSIEQLKQQVSGLRQDLDKRRDK